MRTNPFSELYSQCNNGDPADKYANLPDFPTHIDIEPVSLCNMRCRMCPTGVHALGREQGKMTWETWSKILGAAKDHDCHLRFIGWGEPLLHGSLQYMIGLASEFELHTHVNTNGLLMTADKARELCAEGLSSIKFSFQGINRETYNEMRGQDAFDKIMQAIECMVDARGDTEYPYIAVSTSVTNESEGEIWAFTERLKNVVDHVSIGHTTFDFIELGKAPTKYRELAEQAAQNSTVTKKHPDPCPEVFDKLSIHHNGDVVVCCNAYSNEGVIGNVNDTPLKELWRGKVIEEYRERLARKEYSGPLCEKCYDYMELTEHNK